jgi:hypothetical protein
LCIARSASSRAFRESDWCRRTGRPPIGTWHRKQHDPARAQCHVSGRTIHLQDLQTFSCRSCCKPERRWPRSSPPAPAGFEKRSRGRPPAVPERRMSRRSPQARGGIRGNAPSVASANCVHPATHPAGASRH